MSTITIPKKEYRQLLDKALRYEYLHQIMENEKYSGDYQRFQGDQNIQSTIH